jgi:hypothetical protein
VVLYRSADGAGVNTRRLNLHCHTYDFKFLASHALAYEALAPAMRAARRELYRVRNTSGDGERRSHIDEDIILSRTGEPFGTSRILKGLVACRGLVEPREGSWLKTPLVSQKRRGRQLRYKRTC